MANSKTYPASVDQFAAYGISVDVNENRRNRRDNVFSIGIPFAGGIAAAISMLWVSPSAEVLWIFSAMLFVTTLGTTIGLHRYFTHRSYKTSATVRCLLALFGTIAMQGTIIRWVADHRRHHRFTDLPGDPHSPYFGADGIAAPSKFKGFWHAHTEWMFTGYVTDEMRYAPDMHKDPICLFFSKHYWLVNIVCLALCGVAAYLLTNDLKQGMLGLLYAGLLRIALIHQFTWAVNSIGHMYGSRVPESKDMSTNNIFLALLTIGDGLHSSHHADPVRGVNPPVYFDAGGLLLILLEKLGLVWQLRR